MRPTRLIYIENDPALRSILGKLLNNAPELELLGSFNGSNEALDRNLALKADVALIDFALDVNGLNGVELGIALRNINEHLGIVIYSQFSVRPMINRVPKDMRSGWSFMEKSVLLEVKDYVGILKQTSSGKGNWEEVLNKDSANQVSESNIFLSLTPRQRAIMSLIVQGKSSQEVANQLKLSYSYVRKELSRAYATLVPGSDPSDDLKTKAVFRFLELMRN